MTMEDLLNFCRDNDVEILFRSEPLTDSIEIRMRRKNFAIDSHVRTKETLSRGFGLTIRVILRRMVEALNRKEMEVGEE